MSGSEKATPMARIPEQQVQRLREEISVQRLVEDCGVDLKKTGKDWAGRCPLHEDDTASLVITSAKNLSMITFNDGNLPRFDQAA